MLQHCGIHSPRYLFLLVILQTSGIDDCVSGMAFQLLPNDYIRFLPTPDFFKRNGSASLKYRVWDGTANSCQIPNTGKHARLLVIAVTVVIVVVVVMQTSSKLQSVIYCWSFSLSR